MEEFLFHTLSPTYPRKIFEMAATSLDFSHPKHGVTRHDSGVMTKLLRKASI